VNGRPDRSQEETHEQNDSAIRLDRVCLRRRIRAGDADHRCNVPPNDSKASGTVAVTFDDVSKKITWKGSYKDLTGPATAAHFHGPAAEGKNAGVAIPITPSGPEFEGFATLTEGQAREMLAGEWYVNVHTAANKGGEIRGQLKK
jgi:hypothetical protein